MAVTDVSILKKKRQQKKVLQLLKKLVIFILIVGIVIAVILTRDMWYPKLDGILNKLPVVNNNNSELAEGNFPLSIEGGASYQLETMDNAVAVLDDAHFNVYSTEGKAIFTEQHTLAKPILNVSAKKALIYDLGGNTFTLFSKYKEIYSKSTENAILLARLSSNDYTAVVTKNDKFLSMLMIYDDNGQNIFNYGSVERIIDVTFDSTNSGCYITVIGSSDGVIVSRIMYYRFDSIDYDATGNPVPVWNTDNLETLALSVRLFGEGKIIVFGDTKCAYYDINGSFIGSYEYTQDLHGYDSCENLAALIFKNNERRTSSIVAIDGAEGTVNEITLPSIMDNIQTTDGLIFVHDQSGISAYTTLGELSSSVNLESDFDDFRKINSYIFLMGYDSINRIDFN